MVAGPGAAYICDDCLQLCNDIINDPTPFSAKSLELASRPPVVIAAPQGREQETNKTPLTREPLRSVTLEIEQKQHGMTLLLHQIQYYQTHFELQSAQERPVLLPASFQQRLSHRVGIPELRSEVGQVDRTPVAEA